MSDDMDKYRVLASESRYRSALRFLADFKSATWPDVRDFVSSFVLPGDQFRAFLITSTRYENDGVRPADIPTLADELRFELARKFIALDPLSILGASVPPRDERATVAWAILNPTYFLSPFAGDGGYLTITGKPRTGKTGIGCLYAEMFLAVNPGAEVLTNIPLLKPVNGIRTITGMVELLDGVAAALDAERKWLWALDEAGLVWLKTDVMTSRARGLEKFARIVPKLQGSFIYIEQRIEGVPTVISDFAQSHVACQRPGFAFFELADYMTVRSIPLPRVVKYRSGETGYFEVDLDVDKLLAAMPERGHKSQAERIRSYLEKHKAQVERKHDDFSGRFLPKTKPLEAAAPAAADFTNP